MKKYIKGFTLIELLVVIAIIGILSSVVLVSLNTARRKGQDARVATGVAQLRTKLETDYTTNYNAGFSAANTFVASGDYATLTGDITAQGSAVNVVTNASTPFTTYAIYGRLVSNTNQYFCIDSTGKTNQTAPTNTGSTCP